MGDGPPGPSARGNQTTAAVIPFVDAHHHLWDFDRFKPAWLEPGSEDDTPLIDDYDPLRRPYLVADLLEDFAGSNVIRSVHIQTGYSEIDPVSETAWLQGLAEEHGYPHGIVAAADLSAPDVRDELERHAAYPNMRGVRTFAEGEALLDADFNRGLRALSDLDLVYDLSTTWQGMSAARRMAEQNPDLQVILGHAGLPLERSPDYFENWKKALNGLAAAPNVAVKISGLGLGDNHWTEASIRPWVLEVIEAFGVERSMFGTNWPVDKLFSPYAAVAAAYRSIISDFPLSDQEALLWRNADHYYRLVVDDHDDSEDGPA